MLELSDLLVFTKIVETESLTKTGRLLGLTKSTVSRKMSRIEEHLGVQLLHRSTRAVTVTEQGELFFDYCMRCLGVLRDGERAVQMRHNKPHGVLRVAVPLEFDRTLLGTIFARFLDSYPDLRLVSTVSEDPVGSLRQGFDVAITAGALPLAESTLMAAKLGHTDNGLYAAPVYAECKGLPQSHAFLPRFDLLAVGSVDRLERWQLQTASGEHVAVDFRPRLLSNDLMLLRQAAIEGLGIAVLPAFICKRDLAEGRLIEILPGWKVAGTGFYAIFPNHHEMPARLRAFLDFLVERLRPALSWDMAPASPARATSM
jgi:DNA-binding transcriptional LysR family regulator